MIDLHAIYIILLLAWAAGCGLWTAWGLITRWKVELVMPLVMLGAGSIVLSFFYLLAVIIQDSLVLGIG